MEKAAPNPMKMKEFAEQFLVDTSHRGVPRFLFYGEAPWEWHDGVWRRLSDKAMTRRILGWLIEKDISSKYDVAEETYYAFAATSERRSIEMPCWVDAPKANKSWLSMRNCLINVDALADGQAIIKQEHTPRWFSVTKVNYDFDAEATCPQFEAWIKEVLEEDQERIDTIQEYLGYLLTLDTKEHKALLLIGSAGSGKSTLCEVAKLLVGPSQTRDLAISHFSATFGLAYTEGCHLIICDEAGHPTANDEAAIKRYTGGASVTVARKNGHLFDLRPTARVIFCSNHWPKFKDTSGGIWRRLLPVPMNKTIPEEEFDKGLLGKLEQELPGIANWAIVGLRRLRERGYFKTPTIGAAELAQEKDVAHAHLAYIDQSIVKDPGGFIGNAALKESFEHWLKANAMEVTMPMSQLKREIRRLCGAAEGSKNQGITVRGLTGVRLGRKETP